LAEITLALVLFSDASRVNLGELRRDVGLPIRLLGIGLPLSVLLGGLAAALLLGDLDWALAGFVGAALAPTDAALSAQVITDDRIPLRLRRSLNVESGLNDGIATPIVTVFLIIAATHLGLETTDRETGTALWELAGGVAVGAALGVVGALMIRAASESRWMLSGARQVAALAIAVCAFAMAQLLEVNGFIAAFVAGLAFGTTFARGPRGSELEQVDELTEQGGQLLAFVVWFLFGASLVPIAVDDLDLALVAYAIVSLTLVRMLPVTLSLLRSGLDRPSTVFVGWFGPRGLASVVFALLAVEQLGETSPDVRRAVAAVALTVLASVVLHGVSAGPGGRRYVQAESERAVDADDDDEASVPRAVRYLRLGEDT
ncbi:MAG: cation:proton antiporter, partial [Nocardioides sp.]